ncbi:MAG TPA: ATP-binding cassette domain-containing protein [Phycisphaerales bacterium]|nr:ATP-binding cassette domain-containing protein [Phycisphaerales bacterium]
MPAHAIELKGVRKTFGPMVAVHDLDLVIEDGSLHGFIGPNGAGKTTTIRMIMSILFPDRGDISVLGKRSAIESKDRIGYLPEERGIYKKMKVGPFLKYMAGLKGVPSDGMEKKVRAWLERVGLEGTYRKRCEELSKGMQQKVQFIAAIIHDPDLIILDEPFSGLDPVNSRMLRALIDEQHQQGKTIIFSTHQMSQAEALCDRVVMIHHGHKVLDNTPSRIHSRFDPRSVALEPVRPLSASDLARIEAVPQVESVKQVGRQWQVHARDRVDVAALIPVLAGLVPVRKVELIRPSLEDIFISIVQTSNNPAEHAALLASLHPEGAGAPGEETVAPAAAALVTASGSSGDQGGD